MSDASDPEMTKSFADFDGNELDKLLRQIVDRVRGNYNQNGETARGMPAEVKRIIDANVDRH